MELKDTIELMTSDDYKERIKAEYFQTKIRYSKLHSILMKAETNTLDFQLSCSMEILRKQLHAMSEYLYSLEVRAEIEKIDLKSEDSTISF